MEWLFFGALAIGISLGLFGSGGSIITVPVLIFLLDRPEKLAIAESLAIVGGIALMGAIFHAAKAHIHWPSVVWFGLSGMVGAYLGAYSASYVSSALQITLFAIVMLVAAAMMLFGTPMRSDVFKISNMNTLMRTAYSVVLMVRNGFLVGILTGFLGVGGGFLIVPALVLLGHLPMHMAIGTSLAIISLNAWTGFVEQFLALQQHDLHVSWSVIALVTSIGVCGSLAGTMLNAKIPIQHLRRGFGLFIALIGLYLLV